MSQAPEWKAFLDPIYAAIGVPQRRIVRRWATSAPPRAYNAPPSPPANCPSFQCPAQCPTYRHQSPCRNAT